MRRRGFLSVVAPRSALILGLDDVQGQKTFRGWTVFLAKVNQALPRTIFFLRLLVSVGEYKL
jgi:hypothetical protein